MGDAAGEPADALQALRLEALLLELLALREVGDDGEHPDDVPGTVPERSGRGTELDDRTVPAPPLDLGVRPALAVIRPPEVVEKLLAVLVVDERGEAAERLGFAPAESPLGGRVPANDVSLPVEPDDRRRGGLNELSKHFRGLVKGLLGSLAVCDVLHLRHDVGRPAGGVTHERGVEEDPDLTAALVEVALLHLV